MVLTERVTLFGRALDSPSFELHPTPSSPRIHNVYEDDGDNFSNRVGPLAVKVDGKLVMGIDDTLRTMHAEVKRRASPSNSTTTATNVVVRPGGPVEGGGGETTNDRTTPPPTLGYGSRISSGGNSSPRTIPSDVHPCCSDSSGAGSGRAAGARGLTPCT